MMDLQTTLPIKGRGTPDNPANRFHPIEYVQEEELPDDEKPSPKDLAGRAGIRLGAEEAPSPSSGRSGRRPEGGVYTGPVEVEVGPLRDFAQLSGFEDAASGISAADVAIKRFSEGRATFSMNFAQPVELLRELEERAPFEFKVRDMRGDGVVLDVDDEENRAA